MTERKALAMTEDLDDLMCPHSAAGRPERFPAKACILAGECGCVYGAEWSRSLRLADDAAMQPDPFELTAELGNIHQIADAAMREEGKQ